MSAIKAMIAASTDDKFRMSLVGTVSEGDKVAIEAESLVNLKSGKTYNNKYHMVWTIRGDKVVECREYDDTAHVIDILSDVATGLAIQKKS